MTEHEMKMELDRLVAENSALKAKQPKAPGITLKVSEKGALSVYGLGRWPVTMYRSQVERFLGHADKIRAFIDENAAKLTVKE